MVAAVLLLGVIILVLVKLIAASRPPRWVIFDSVMLSMDEPPRALMLRDKKVTVKDPKGNVLFETPKDWYIQNMLLEDINEDSVPEMILLVWKKGSYGEHLPFWVPENDDRIEQHIFVYSCDDTGVHPIWMSSTVSDSIATISLRSKDILVSFRDGQTSLWGWRSWGLELIEDGSSGSSENGSHDGNGDSSGKEDEVTFIALGDLILHQSLIDYGEKHGGYRFLFDPMRQLISSADIAILNQETPFAASPEKYSDYPLFGTPSAVGEAILGAGFDVISLATNHMLDQGEEGIQTTLQFYENAMQQLENSPNDPPLLALGVQSDDTAAENIPYQLLQIKGFTFAFLNYTYGTNGQPLPEGQPYAVHLLDDPERIRQDIEDASSSADLVIVLVHWGEEYDPHPTAMQEEWCQRFLEYGVDVVIGSHPHVVQKVEMMTSEDGRRMLVYYSLGNYVSGQGTLSENELSAYYADMKLTEGEANSLLVLGGMASFTVKRDESGAAAITDYALSPVACHQAYGLYTAYLLEEYPSDMAANHRLGISKSDLESLYQKLTEN